MCGNSKVLSWPSSLLTFSSYLSVIITIILLCCRLHETLSCSETFHSLLLDIDHRYVSTSFIVCPCRSPKHCLLIFWIGTIFLSGEIPKVQHVYLPFLRERRKEGLRGVPNLIPREGGHCGGPSVWRASDSAGCWIAGTMENGWRW